MKSKKGGFSKLIVLFCIFEMTFMQLWSMRIASHLQYDVSSLLLANHGVFGGELLLLCLKRIFADNKKSSYEDESSNSEDNL